jgi:hypothetical protein
LFVGGIKPVGYKPPIKKPVRILPRTNVRYTPEGKPYKRIWDNVKEMDEIMLGDYSKLVISVTAFNGNKFLTLSKWHYSAKDEMWYPSRKNLTLPLLINRDGEVMEPLGRLPEVISEALGIYEDLPIYDYDNQVWAPKKEKKKKK